MIGLELLKGDMIGLIPCHCSSMNAVNEIVRQITNAETTPGE
jgi:metal-dependent hydrolase (beta-lactamase superfamily II)